MMQNKMVLVGIKTRTSNVDEMNGAGHIASLWSRFFSENIAQKIPAKMSEEIFSLYFDYETDSTGAYSVLLGVKVSETQSVPEGLEVVEVPQQRYQVFPCATGSMPQVVIEGWQKVWSQERTGELTRKYSYDFELYPSESGAPVSIFIAV